MNAQSAGDRTSSGSTSGSTTSPAPTTKKAPAPTATPQAQRQQVVDDLAAPADVTVRVSNATTQSGLATTATGQLRRSGFNVMTPDDYPSPVNATTVLFSPGNEQAAATVADGLRQFAKVRAGFRLRAGCPGGAWPGLQLGDTIAATQRLVGHRAVSTGAPATRQAQLPEDLTVTNAADTTCE
jgi:hypothetical protein